MEPSESELLHHGLMVIDRDYGEPGIYWLRLWKIKRSHVAIVTEVPGNPWPSVTNWISLIHAHLVTAFNVDPGRLTLFEIWPQGSINAEDSAGHSRVDFDPSPEWTEVSRTELEAATGGALPPLPSHDDLYDQVRAAGGGLSQSIYRRVFAAVPVTEIPVPHCPARCRHFARFQQIQRELEGPTGNRAEREQKVGRKFIDSLSWWDRYRCRFHRGRWRVIADESVRIIEQLGPADSDVYHDEAARAPLNDRDLWWLTSLFSDPIDIAGGGFTNGQHRACALRFSGGERAALAIEDEYLGEEEIVWTYEGEG